MLMFFAAGNEGSNTPPYNRIVRLASAKSIVTVGATERYWSSDPNRSPENMFSVSGWGPAADGRIKPDVTASGFKVRVPWLNDPSGTTCETVPEPLGTLGTSYASPIAASAAALVREYYRGGYYPGGTFDPSAALVKATLINSGRNMIGSLTGGDIPGDKQGWGRITLDDALRFNGEPGELQVIDNLTGLATGQQTSYMIQVPNDNRVWELKVTLVWTDWPGATMANPALVNDLDLKVTGPSGTYLGNVFIDGFSVSGGAQDRLNVVEQVYLSKVEGTLTPGSYTITVSGYNVPFGVSPNTTQPYALLINLKLPHTQYLPVFINDGGTSAPATGGYPAPQSTETPSAPYP